MNWYERDRERRELSTSLRIAGTIFLILVGAATLAFLLH